MKQRLLRHLPLLTSWVAYLGVSEHLDGPFEGSFAGRLAGDEDEHSMGPQQHWVLRGDLHGLVVQGAGTVEVMPLCV
eukprot:CAMPEP_0185775614 /NCGR_PEP_ID=MMETSP1174-20130828/82683_1 /TAXON_ID=35687 /ORGANISM="Dictyocha speculum, Strain CCMP1381" /LENGTH=76 /DNA_ID=CAMNT_0028463255 /DNA_START=537 /DNA_END=767 /DNA_ORIENTATION=-